jgi:phosphate starvation-inducible PhoH-like protein
VEINNRGNSFRIIGTPKSVEIANRLLKDLYDSTSREILSSDRIHLHLQDTNLDEELESELEKEVTIKTRRGLIKGRSPNQRLYLQNILHHDISFGIGPAGTGKTYLAVATAAAMLIAGRVDRIILSRPAVEAGERLGFLPGDLREKIDPYLAPLYDALYDMLPADQVVNRLNSGEIEVAPLAFMRGRTLSHAYVILDEAQNATPIQMKMFLTRIGEGSRMAITGDPSQVDLPPGSISGLLHAVGTLKDIEDVRIVRFTDADVARHSLVTRIVQAYDEEDRRAAAGRAGRTKKE